MVKTKGPLLAASASGAIGPLVFTASKSTGQLKTRPRTFGPPTRPQLAYRVWMAWLTRAWTPLTAAEKATWTAVAGEHQLSPYHMFLKHNSDRWSHGLCPSKRFPTTEAPPAASYGYRTATTTRRSCRLNINVGALPQCWFIAWHRKLISAGASRKPTELVAAATAIVTAETTLLDDTAIPGVTYRYSFTIGTDTGLLYYPGSVDDLTATN